MPLASITIACTQTMVFATRVVRAARAVRAFLKRIQRDDSKDAQVTAALELVERVIELVPRRDRVPRPPER